MRILLTLCSTYGSIRKKAESTNTGDEKKREQKLK